MRRVAAAFVNTGWTKQTIPGGYRFIRPPVAFTGNLSVRIVKTESGKYTCSIRNMFVPSALRFRESKTSLGAVVELYRGQEEGPLKQLFEEVLDELGVENPCN